MTTLPKIVARIGGRDIVAGHSALPVVNPTTEIPMAEIDESGPGEVAAAVAAARETFESGVWSGSEYAARRPILRRIAEAIRSHARELIALQVAESGLPIASARGQVAAGAAWFDYYADFLATVGGQAYRHVAGATAFVEREPVGVCALFSPWNVPVGLSAIKLAPALAAGNSVVLKPSEFTPGVTRRLVELIENSGLPAGVVNCVNGRGSVTGAALAEAVGVDMVSFTGGAIGGRAVAEAAARRGVPCVMELGGKSASVVFEDADFDAAVAGAARSIYSNNGQACLAGSRILVADTIADRFFEAFAARARALRIGDPTDEKVDLGPMISAVQRTRVLGYCARSREAGDEVLFGGGPPVDHTVGFFVEPTGVHVRSGASAVWREEIFGPVAAFATFDSEATAVAKANDSEFGLAGYVWTADSSRALRVARRLRTGTVIVNNSFLREPNAPFGGFKASGIGREGGAYSWVNFTQAKTTVVHHG